MWETSNGQTRRFLSWLYSHRQGPQGRWATSSCREGRTPASPCRRSQSPGSLQHQSHSPPPSPTGTKGHPPLHTVTPPSYSSWLVIPSPSVTAVRSGRGHGVLLPRGWEYVWLMKPLPVSCVQCVMCSVMHITLGHECRPPHWGERNALPHTHTVGYMTTWDMPRVRQHAPLWQCVVTGAGLRGQEEAAVSCVGPSSICQVLDLDVVSIITNGQNTSQTAHRFVSARKSRVF